MTYDESGEMFESGFADTYFEIIPPVLMGVRGPPNTLSELIYIEVLSSISSQ